MVAYFAHRGIAIFPSILHNWLNDWPALVQTNTVKDKNITLFQGISANNITFQIDLAPLFLLLICANKASDMNTLVDSLI